MDPVRGDSTVMQCLDVLVWFGTVSPYLADQTVGQSLLIWLTKQWDIFSLFGWLDNDVKLGDAFSLVWECICESCDVPLGILSVPLSRCS